MKYLLLFLLLAGCKEHKTETVAQIPDTIPDKFGLKSAVDTIWYGPPIDTFITAWHHHSPRKKKN